VIVVPDIVVAVRAAVANVAPDTVIVPAVAKVMISFPVIPITPPLAKRMSSPTNKSFATPRPPSVCMEPVVPEVESVASSMESMPEPTMVVAV